MEDTTTMPLPDNTGANLDRPTPTRAQVQDHLGALEGHSDPAMRQAGADLSLYLARRGSQHGFHELLEGIHTRLDRLTMPNGDSDASGVHRALPGAGKPDDRVHVELGPFKLQARLLHLVLLLLLALALVGAGAVWDMLGQHRGAAPLPTTTLEATGG